MFYLTLTDLTISAVISDQLSTIKAGAALKIDKDTTAAAEAIYKLNGGDLKLAAGIATKLDNGHAVRGTSLFTFTSLFVLPYGQCD